MKINNYISILLVCFCGCFSGVSLWAQETELSGQIKGKVVNSYNEPLSDVLITSENGINEYLTNINGAFELTINDGSRFVIFSSYGYKDQKMALEDLNAEIEIVMAYDVHRVGGTLNLGYFNQSREANVGAVATVSGAELDRAPVSILSQTFAGRLSGLSTIEGSSELNGAGVTKWIRGVSTTNGFQPLVIIDGVVCPNVYYEYLSPKEIDNVTVLKDASATSIYGIQGAAGAIVITTKRGHTGEGRINVYVDQAFQQMTRRPEFVSSYEYAQLRNQAGVNDGLGAYSQFSQAQLDKFKDGTDPLYPNNDWYGMFVRKTTMMQRAGVNVSGGNEKVRYFSNVNYLHQSSPFKVADEPDRNYDPTPNMHAINFRSNLDLRFNNYVSAFMNLSGNVNYETGSPHDKNAIYSLIFSLPPTLYGPLTPVPEADPDTGELPYDANQVVTNDREDNPVYGLLNRSGYARWLRTNVMAQAGVTLDMSFLAQGLSATGSMAYQTFTNNVTYTTQEFMRYVRSSDVSQLDFSRKGSWENTPLGYGKATVFFYNLNLMAHLDYQRRFGDHSISAMAYIHYLVQEKEVTSGAGILPYKRENMGVTALYGYKDRYFIKGDLGYSGSEQFHPDHRHIATPAIGASWIVSKEDFMGNADWLSLLKLRASYGVTANDQFGDSRFLYLDYLDMYGTIGLRGNPELSGEKIIKKNVGVDLGLFDAITLSFDYFMHNVDNMLVSNAGSVPAFQGVPLGYFPRLNNGKMENKGYEIEVSYSKRLTQDWSVFASAGFTSSANKVINVNEAPRGADYAYKYRTEGYKYGQPWGLLVDYSNGNGMFNSQAEISNSNLTYDFGVPRVGDFIYQDLNNDGVIDDRDEAPVGNCAYPDNYFHFDGGFGFKGFELNFMFQGINSASIVLGGIGAIEFEREGVFNDIHKNAWTPERYANNGKIDYPALSLNQTTNHRVNDYFIMDRSFWRLRNVELAYTLPAGITEKMKVDRIRFSLNAQNLFTIDKMKSKYIDPEVGQMGAFQPYRVFNIGVNLTF